MDKLLDRRLVKLDMETTVQKREADPSGLPTEPASAGSSLCPLSYNQQALWYIAQRLPASAAYNIAFAARILSTVDSVALQRAFQTLVDWHSALRTTFTIQAGTTQAGVPLQVIHAAQVVDFVQLDAALLSWERLIEQVHAAYRTPFQLDKGPLFRVRLWTRAADDHILLITVHHIVADAGSIWLLLNELRVLYPTLKFSSAGTQFVAPATLARPNTDFVRWQAEMLQQQGAELAAFWQTRLAGELPLLDLPLSRPRPPVQLDHGASYFFKLPKDLTQQLKNLAATSGTTLYRTLLAAFQILLQRYTGQADISVGCPASGRTRPELKGLVGYLSNMVVLRSNLAQQTSFTAFLRQVDNMVAEAVQAQDYPFLQLVNLLQPARDSSYSPLVQAIFNWPKPAPELADFWLADEDSLRAPHNPEQRTLQWGELTLAPFMLPHQEGQADLFLEMAENNEQVRAVFRYNTDIFELATIQQMAGHFQTLLANIVADPQQALADLQLITDRQRHQLLVEWNATGAVYPSEKSIHQLFEEQVARTPQAVALITNKRGEDKFPQLSSIATVGGTSFAAAQQTRITYDELNRRANQLAHYLQTLGVGGVLGAETVVGLCVERSIDMVVGILGILKAGGAYLPLDPTYPKERLAYMLADSQATILLSQHSLADQLPPHQARLLYLDDIPDQATAEAAANLNLPLRSDHLAYLMYTSGSTGQPKGVEATHRNIVNRLYWMWNTVPFAESEVACQKTALSFVDSVWEILGPLLGGIPSVIIPDAVLRDPQQLVRTLAEGGVTRFVLVPSLLHTLLVGFPDLQTRLPKLREWTCSGEALSTELLQRFQQVMPAARLLNLYGSSEVAADATWFDTSCPAAAPDQSMAGVPIGRPIANMQAYIVDQALKPTAIGVAGELLIGGDGVARGYYNRPDLTQAKFIANPFGAGRLYRTGDRARYLADGNIEFLGRIDHQVKIRGFRIELGEIETALRQHPGIAQVVVTTAGDTPVRQQLVAYVVPKETQAATLPAAELRALLNQQLPEYMIPADFVFLAKFPLTPNGKLDRRSLLASHPIRMEGGAKATYLPPADPIEHKLVSIWQEVLNRPTVGVLDRFFELGGNSLLAAQVHLRICALFPRCNLSLVEMFQYPTIRALSDYLKRNEQNQFGRETSQQRAETRKMGVQQHRVQRQRTKVEM